jgi:hypothetical protein
MPKHDSELPGDISARLDEVIDRVMSAASATIRREVQHMFRFSNMDEVDAARIVLAENEKPMHVDAIVGELKAGGIWRPASGAKGSSADTEMRRSISRAATHAVNLKFVDREKEIIGLVDWPEGK